MSVTDGNFRTDTSYLWAVQTKKRSDIMTDGYSSIPSSLSCSRTFSSQL